MNLLCKLILLLFVILPFDIQSQVCYNADFELGNFTGWTGRRGDCCPINLTNNGITNNRQTIMSPGIDPNTCGGLSTVYSGNFSARLGNDNIGAQAEALYFTFVVTPQSTLIRYSYAVVFEDPGHTSDEQPRFNSRVRLSDGSIITCTDYMVTAASDLPGFQYCPSIDSQGDPVNIAWRDWATISVDLSDYVGQSVTLEFETGDCSLGGHFGYAYIDAISCSTNEIEVQYCVDDTLATLIAPSGFETYLWETGETTPSIVVDPDLYDSLSCYLTTATGCELTLTARLLASSPVANFSYDGQCQGLFQFQNLSTIPTLQNVSYLWSFGDGTTSNTTNPIHNFPNPGIYNVTLDVLTSNGCSNSIIVPVQVYPLPNSSFVTQNVCFGDQSLFTNTTPQFLNYNTSSQWYFGDGNTSSEWSTSHIFNSSGDFSITLIVSVDGSSCSDTTTQQISVYQNPQAAFSVENVCQGQNSVFTNNSIFPTWSQNVQYEWSLGEFGLTSQISSPVYVYTGEGTFNISLTVTSSLNGISCSDTFNSVTTVYPNPGVVFSYNNILCEDDTVLFINLSTISNTSEISSHNWQFGDGFSSNLENPIHVYQNPGVFNVSLTSTSNFGCSRTFQNQITIKPKPFVEFSPNSGSGCPPLSVSFSDSSNGQISSWIWNFGDNQFSTLQNPTHVYNNSGIYYVTLEVTDFNGCSNTSQVPATIFVYDEPVAGFTVFSPNLDEINPTINISNYSIDATSYFWNFGDSSTSNLFEPQHTYGSSGEYLIQLFVENQFNCKDTADVLINVKPIFTFYIPNAFTPNTSNNELFSGKGTNYKSVTMQIFNRWGEKIYDKTSSEPPLWDGKYRGENCQVDVYVYQFFVVDIFEELHVYRGRVTLVR